MQHTDTAAAIDNCGPDASHSAIVNAVDALYQVRAILAVARLGVESFHKGDPRLESEGMTGADVVDRALRCAEEQTDQALAALSAAERALLAH
jgi:hypothetical protein